VRRERRGGGGAKEDLLSLFSLLERLVVPLVCLELRVLEGVVLMSGDDPLGLRLHHVSSDDSADTADGGLVVLGAHGRVHIDRPCAVAALDGGASEGGAVDELLLQVGDSLGVTR
jgi:hypothetical protein